MAASSGRSQFLAANGRAFLSEQAVLDGFIVPVEVRPPTAAVMNDFTNHSLSPTSSYSPSTTSSRSSTVVEVDSYVALKPQVSRFDANSVQEYDLANWRGPPLINYPLLLQSSSMDLVTKIATGKARLETETVMLLDTLHKRAIDNIWKENCPAPLVLPVTDTDIEDFEDAKRRFQNLLAVQETMNRNVRAEPTPFVPETNLNYLSTNNLIHTLGYSLAEKDDLLKKLKDFQVAGIPLELQHQIDAVNVTILNIGIPEHTVAIGVDEDFDEFVKSITETSGLGRTIAESQRMALEKLHTKLYEVGVKAKEENKFDKVRKGASGSNAPIENSKVLVGATGNSFIKTTELNSKPNQVARHPVSTLNDTGIPVCLDYKNGRCNRSQGSCRFRHDYK